MDSSINKGSKPTLVDEEDDLGLQHNRNNGSAKQSEEITIVIEKAIKGMLERTRFGSTSVGTTNYIDSENVDQEECESAIFEETVHNSCNISKPVTANNVQFQPDHTLHGYAVATAEEICLGNEIVEISANDSDSSLRKDYIDNNESSIIDSDALGSEDVSAEEVLDEFETRAHFEHLPTSSFSDSRKSGYDTPYINSISRDDSIEEYHSEKSSNIKKYKEENVTSVKLNKKSSTPIDLKKETALNMSQSNQSQSNNRATSDSLKFFYESIASNLADDDKNNSLDVIEESSKFLSSENNSFDEDRMPVLVNETEVITVPFAEDKPPPELIPENIQVTEQVIGVVHPFNHEQCFNTGKQVKEALGMSSLSNSRKPFNPPTEVITRNRIRSHCLDSVTGVSRSMVKKQDSFRTVILKHDATKKAIPTIVNGISDKCDMKPEYINNEVNIRQGISSGNYFRVPYNGTKPVSCEDIKEISNVSECPLSDHRLPLTIQNHSTKVPEKHKFSSSTYNFTDGSCDNVTVNCNNQSEFITEGSATGMENRRRKIHGFEEKIRNAKNNTYYNNVSNVQSEIITMNERKKSLRGNSPNNISVLPSMPILLSPTREETHNHAPDTNNDEGGTSKKSENHEIVKKQKPTRSTATQLRSFQRLSFKELSQSLKQQKLSKKVEYLANKPLLVAAREKINENSVPQAKLELYNNLKSIGVDGFEHNLDNDLNVRITRSSSKKKECLEEITKSSMKDALSKKQIKNSVVNPIDSSDSISLPVETMIIGTKEIDNSFKVFDNLLTDLDLDKTPTNPLDEAVPSFDPFIKDIQPTPDILEVLPGADILDGGITGKEIIISSADVGVIKNDILEEEQGPCLEDGTFSSILNFFDKDLSSERTVQMQQNDTIDNPEQLFNKSDFPVSTPKTDNVFEVGKSDFVTIQNPNTLETSKGSCNELNKSLTNVGEELIDKISNSDRCSVKKDDSSNCDGNKSEQISCVVAFRNKGKVFPLIIPTEQNDYDLKNSLYSEIEKIDQVLDRELASSLSEDNSNRSCQENSTDFPNNQSCNEKILVKIDNMKEVNDHGSDLLTSSCDKQTSNSTKVIKKIDSSNSKVDLFKQQNVLDSDSAVNSRMFDEKVQKPDNYLEDISDGDFEIDESSEDDKKAQNNKNNAGNNGLNNYKHVPNNLGNSVRNIGITASASSQKCVNKKVTYRREVHKLPNCSNIRFSKGSLSFNVPPHSNPKNRVYDRTDTCKPFVQMRRKNGRKRSRITKRQRNLNKLKLLSNNSVSSSNVFSTLQQKEKLVGSSGPVKKFDSNSQSVNGDSVLNNLSSTSDKGSAVKASPLPQKKCGFESAFQKNKKLLLDNKKALSNNKNESVLHLDSETKRSVNCLSENNIGSFKLNSGMKNIAEDCLLVGELTVAEKTKYCVEISETPKEKSGSLGDEINVPIMPDINTSQPSSTVDICINKQNVNQFQVLAEINSSNTSDDPNQLVQMEEPCTNHLDLSTGKNFSSDQNLKTIKKSDCIQDSLGRNTQKVLNVNNPVVEVHKNIVMTSKIVENDISSNNALLKDPKLNDSNEVMPEMTTHPKQCEKVPDKIPDIPSEKGCIITSIVIAESYDKQVSLSNETSETLSTNKLIGFDIMHNESCVSSVLSSGISNLDGSESDLNLNKQNVSNNDKELTKSPQHKKKQEPKDKKSGLEDIIKKLTLKSEVLINYEEINKKNPESFNTDTNSVNTLEKPAVGNENEEVKDEKSLEIVLGCDGNKIETEIIDDHLDAQLEMELNYMKCNNTSEIDLANSQEFEKTVNSLNEKRITTNTVKAFLTGNLIFDKQSPQISLNDSPSSVTSKPQVNSSEIISKIKSKNVELSAMDLAKVQLLSSTGQSIETLSVGQEVVSKVEVDTNSLGHSNELGTCPNFLLTSVDMSENDSKSSDQDMNIDESGKFTTALEAVEVADVDAEQTSRIPLNESAVISEAPIIFSVSPSTESTTTENSTSLPNEIIHKADEHSPQGSEHCEENKLFKETVHGNESSDANKNCDGCNYISIEAGNDHVLNLDPSLKAKKWENHCPLKSVSETKKYTLKNEEQLHSSPRMTKGDAGFESDFDSVVNESMSATSNKQALDGVCIKQSNESYKKEIIHNKTNENLDESKLALAPSEALELCVGELQESDILIETENVNITGSEMDIYSKTVTNKKADQQVSLTPSDAVPVEADSTGEKYFKKSSEQIIGKDESRLEISDHLKCVSLPNSEGGTKTGKDIINTLTDDSQKKSENFSDIANSEFSNGNKPVVSQDFSDMIIESEIEANQSVQKTNNGYLSNDLMHTELSKIRENITKNISIDNFNLSEIIDEKSVILDNNSTDSEAIIGETSISTDSDNCMPEENINGKNPSKNQPLESLIGVHNNIVSDIDTNKVDDVCSEISIEKSFGSSSNTEVLGSDEINSAMCNLQDGIEKPNKINILDTFSAKPEIVSNFQEEDNNSKRKEKPLEHCENMEQDLISKSTPHLEIEEGSLGDSVSFTKSDDARSEKCFQPEGVVYGEPVNSGTTNNNEIYKDSNISPDTSKHDADIDIKSSRDAFTSWLLTKSNKFATKYDSTNSLMPNVNELEKFSHSMVIEKVGGEVLEKSEIVHENSNMLSSTVIFTNPVNNREAKSSVDLDIIPEIYENTDKNDRVNLLESAENKLTNHNEESLSCTKSIENYVKSSSNACDDSLAAQLIKVYDIKSVTELSNLTDVSKNHPDFSSEPKENKPEDYKQLIKKDSESIYCSSKIKERESKLVLETKAAVSVSFSNHEEIIYMKRAGKTSSDTLKSEDMNSESIEEPNDGEKTTECEEEVDIDSEVNTTLKSLETSVKLVVSQANINNERNGTVVSCDKKSTDVSNPDIIIDEAGGKLSCSPLKSQDKTSGRMDEANNDMENSNEEKHTVYEEEIRIESDVDFPQAESNDERNGNAVSYDRKTTDLSNPDGISDINGASDRMPSNPLKFNDNNSERTEEVNVAKNSIKEKYVEWDDGTEVDSISLNSSEDSIKIGNTQVELNDGKTNEVNYDNKSSDLTNTGMIAYMDEETGKTLCGHLNSPDEESRSIVEASNDTKNSKEEKHIVYEEEVSIDSMTVPSLKSAGHAIKVDIFPAEINGERSADVLNCDSKSRVSSGLGEIIITEDKVGKTSPNPLKSQDVNSENAEESNDIEKSTKYEVGIAVDSEVITSLKSSEHSTLVCISQLEINDENNGNAFSFNMKSTDINPDVIIHDAGSKMPTSPLKSQDKFSESMEIAKEMENPNKRKLMEYKEHAGIYSDVTISVKFAEQSVEVNISQIEIDGEINANVVSCDSKSSVSSKPSKIMNLEGEAGKMAFDLLNYQNNLESKEEPNDTENKIVEKHMNSEEDANGDSGIIDDVETEGDNRGVSLKIPEGIVNTDLSEQTIIEGESEALDHRITESTLNPYNSISDYPLENTNKLPVSLESSGNIDKKKPSKDIYLKTEVMSGNADVCGGAVIENKKDKVSLLSSNDVCKKLAVSINGSDIKEKINKKPQEKEIANVDNENNVELNKQELNFEPSLEISEVNTNSEPIDSIPVFEEMSGSQTTTDRVIEEKTSDKSIESSDSCNDEMNNNPKPHLTDTVEEDEVTTSTNEKGKENLQTNSVPSEHQYSGSKIIQESTNQERNPQNCDNPSFEQISGNGESYMAESEACDDSIVADDRVFKNCLNLDQIGCEDTIENCSSNTHKNSLEQVGNNSSASSCHQSSYVSPKKLISPLDDKSSLDLCLVGMSQKSETKLVSDPGGSQATACSFCELTDYIPPPNFNMPLQDNSSESISSMLNYENSPNPYQWNDDCPTTSNHQKVSVSTNVVVNNYFESAESKAVIYKKTELSKAVTNEISESNPSKLSENTLSPVVPIQKSRSKKRPASKSLPINDELPHISHKSEAESSTKLSYSKLDYLRSRHLMAMSHTRKRIYEKKENIKSNKSDLIPEKTKSKISCILSDIVHQSEYNITRDLTHGQDEVLLRLVNQYTDSPKNQLIPSNQSGETSERTSLSIVKSDNTISVKSQKALDRFKLPDKSKNDEKISKNITSDKSNFSSSHSVCGNTVEAKNIKSEIPQKLKEKYMLKELKIVLEKVDVDIMKQMSESNVEINKKKRKIFGCNFPMKRSTTLSDQDEPPRKILHIHSPKSSFADSQIAININQKIRNIRNNTSANRITKYVQTSKSLTNAKIKENYIIQVAEMNARTEENYDLMLPRLDSFANIQRCMHKNNVKRAFVPENIYNTLKKDDLTSIHSDLEIICNKSVERKTRFKRRRRKSSLDMDNEMEREDNFSSDMSMRLRRRLPKKIRHSKRLKYNGSDMKLDSAEKLIPSRINAKHGERLADPQGEESKQSRLLMEERKRRHYYRESESEALPKRPNLAHSCSNVCSKEPEIIQRSTAMDTIFIHRSSYRALDRGNSTKEEIAMNEEFSISTYLKGLAAFSNNSDDDTRDLLHHVIRNRSVKTRRISETEEDSDDDFLGFEESNNCSCKLENNLEVTLCPNNCSLSRSRIKWGYLNRIILGLFSRRTVEPVTYPTRSIDQISDVDRTFELFSDSNCYIEKVSNSTVDSCSKNSGQSERGRFHNFRLSSEESGKERDGRSTRKNLELHHQTSTKPFRDPGICFVSLAARNSTVSKKEEQERFLISEDSFSGHSQLVTAKNVEAMERRGQTSLPHPSNIESSSSFSDCEKDEYEEDTISS